MGGRFHKSFFKMLFTIVIPIIFVIIVFSIYLFDKLLDDKKAFLFEKSAAIASMISNIEVDNTSTISQVQNTFQSLNDKELGLEYLVGKISDNKIDYIAYSDTKPHSVKLEYVTIAVQMRKAISGESGVGIGVDYNNKKVFASYHPIKNTKWGLVIKQSYDSHVNILYKTAWMSSLATLLLIVFLYIILQKYNSKNQKKIEYSEHRFQQLVESSHDFIWEVNTYGVYKYASEQIEDILGYKSQEIVGKTPFDFMSDEEASKLRLVFMQTVEQETIIVNLENINIHKDGHNVYLQTNGSPFFDEDGRLLGYRGVDRDITELKIKQKEMETLAYFDALTGLSNRLSINIRIEEEIGFSLRNSTTSALLFLDLDNFKIINDSFGHEHGDEVLRVVSKRIVKILRSFDIAGRIGGDEFIILVRGAEKECKECLVFLDTLVDRLIVEINRPILFKEYTHHVGVSIGIALIPQDGKDLEEVIQHADSAMYEAKRLGKNQAAFYK